MTAPDGSLPLGALRRLVGDPGPWLSCDDCFRLADRYVEGLLAGGHDPADAEMAAMPAHLVGCSACAEEATTLLLLAAEETGVDPTTALRRLPAQD
jgi:hypothetical protein